MVRSTERSDKTGGTFEIKLKMATVQAPPEVKVSSRSQEPSGYLSLTMTALRLVNTWSTNWTETVPVQEDPSHRIITLDEVSEHDTPGDCWVVIYDRVYDITTFLNEVSIDVIYIIPSPVPFGSLNQTVCQGTQQNTFVNLSWPWYIIRGCSLRGF